MQNLTEYPGNSTFNTGPIIALKMCLVIPLFCIFLYFIVLMLHTLASHRQFWENPRYILFGYMLINDALLVGCSVLLFILFLAQLRLSIILCMSMIFVSTATFLNTPFILATMSLERYVAIFYPLHRPAAWRADCIWAVILPTLLISLAIPTIELCLGRQYPGSSAFTTMVLCRSKDLHNSPLMTLVKVSLYGMFFVATALTILFTYGRILQKARTMRRDEAVGKALYTVLLHGLQLLLCIMTFTQPVTEQLIVVHSRWLKEQIPFLNYLFFALLPRFLSPLIYGLRDESLRTHLKTAILCCSPNITPQQTGKPLRSVKAG
ncbi:odorant receptor 131-2-like [Conger conger]|uniref:odorant receptor 131-2-like n=1 Tax=Conger conger TaxID=82655 RepID=UPI002A5A4A62|nr:odorant receptor 131-2-like [Conger conger]